MTAITYQHRPAQLIPGDDAGEFAILLDLPHASDRVIDAISTLSPDDRQALRRAADTYREEYAETGLLGSADASPGRSAGGRNALERMGDAEMSAWRDHNSARRSMSPAEAIEVDRVVLDNRDDFPRVEFLVGGLRELLAHYERKSA